MPHAAIYLRMSLDRELGIDRQREDCTALAERHGYDYAEYVDNDRSATRGIRPQYQLMLKDIESGDIKTIIVWHTDRLYRKLDDLLPLIKLCERNNVDILTVQAGNIDLSTDAGRLNAKILGAVAENEGERRTARQVRALKQAAEMGKAAGAPCFGYTAVNTKDGAVPEVIPEEAEHIRWAYAEVIAGTSLHQIARHFHEAGLKTRPGNDWTGTQIGRMLRNPRYAGLKAYKGEVIGKGLWEPIVAEETWENAQIILSAPGRALATSRHPNQARTQLLGGILKCSECGSPLRAGRVVRKGYNKAVYRCRNEISCRHPAHRMMDRMDTYITQIILERLKKGDWIAATSSDAAKAKDLHAEIMKLRGRLEAFEADYTEGNITGGQLKAATDKVKAQVEELEEKLLRINHSRVFDGIATSDDIEKTWDELSLDRKRGIITALCDEIIVHPTGVTGRGAAKLPLKHNITVKWRKPQKD